MQRKAALPILAISATLLLVTGVAAREASPLLGSEPPQAEFAPGQLLIRFLPSVSPGRADEILSERGAAEIRSLKALNVRVLRLPPGLSVERAVEVFSRIPEVEFAEPNYVVRALAPSRVVVDVYDQWGLEKIQAPQAWVPFGASPDPVLIAVTDTGIDSGHSDLLPNIWTNPGEEGIDSEGRDKASNGVDDDGNGYVDDTWGWDFINNDNDPTDDHFHGTVVSSVAAAAKGNGGMAGVCPWCQLAGVKVLDSGGGGFIDTVADGIVYAAEGIGASVINLSLGGAGGSQTFEDAVDRAWAAGALVVAAAGNDGGDVRSYPAAYANAMAIASTNVDDYRSCFSNWGEDYVSVAAPGESLIGAMPGGGYETWSGTSLSAPHVSGLGALLFSQADGRTNSEVRSIIESAVEDLWPAGADPYFGTGRINAYWAVTGLTDLTPPESGMFTDDLSASGYAHARKLVRDASGNLHLVWHGKDGGEYQVLYATYPAGGAAWSSAEVVFFSTAETFHPALATDGTTLYLAFPTKDGSPTSHYRIKFMSRSASEGGWSSIAVPISGSFHAVRPDLFVDPGNNRLHLVASSFDDAQYVYYTQSSSADLNWSPVQQINVGGSQRTRYADVHASGPNVYIAGRTVQFVWFGLIPRYRVFTIRSTDGGGNWGNLTELAVHDGLYSGEYGVSLAGAGDDLDLTYEHNGAIFFRQSTDGVAWSAAANLGGGVWPSITQANDGQAWAVWEGGGNLTLRHYDGATWHGVETLGAGNYPNLKLGTGGSAIQWVNTHCSGAPFRITSASRSLVANAPPLADAGGTYTGSEDAAIAFDGSGSSDPDGDPLTYTWDFGDGATGTGVSPSHTYAYGATFTVTLTVSDGRGETDTDTATADVTEVNDPPVADPNGPYTGVAGEPTTFDGSGSYDPDNQDGTAANDQTLTYSWDFGDGNPGAGVNPTHTYASAEEYTVTLTVSDGTDSDSAATAASITAPNTAPTADDKNATTEEDTAVTVTLTAEDPEECELTFSIVELPTNGTLSGFADQVCGAGSPNTDSGSVTYTPDPDFNGTDSFTYKANDGLTASNVATVTITVSAVNDPPVAMGDSASTSQDTPVTISVLANDSDVDGDPLTVTSATDPPKGSASVNGDYSITYAPDAGFFGTDSFDYSVSDGKGGTDTGTVSVTVTQAATMHVGDLDGWSAKLQKGRWKAVVAITVHGQTGQPLPGATVTGTFSQNGSIISPPSCTTDATGTCPIDSGQLPRKGGQVTFTVDSVSLVGWIYDPLANHDPDGDSDGTTIQVSK